MRTVTLLDNATLPSQDFKICFISEVLAYRTIDTVGAIFDWELF
jgi:hypothetical protein